MIPIEQRVREAYDAQHLPDEVRARALASIEAARSAEDARRASDASGPGAPSRPESCQNPETAATLLPRCRKRPSSARRWLAAAACLVLVLVALGAYGVYRIPSAYVDIDVNPAIELTVNPFGTVIAAEALNDDGLLVLDGVSLLHRPYAEAIGALVASEAFGAYADADAFVDINIVSEDKGLGKRLAAQSDEAMAEVAAEHACHHADEATRQEAAAAGLCIGRYRAAQELMELDPSYSLEDCAAMSMRELREHIDACHREGGEASSSQGHGGGHHGRGTGRAAAGAHHEE